MIIWHKDGYHQIRINGTYKVDIRNTLFPLDTNKEDNELSVKEYVDPFISGYHMYMHIFKKATTIAPVERLQYSMWLGSDKIEPPLNWWEDLDG